MDLQQRILRLAWGLQGDSVTKKIERYADKPNTFIRYTNGRFVGPNPNYADCNPTGIFGFPFVAKLLPSNKQIKRSVPHYLHEVLECKYSIIFSVKRPDKMLDCPKYLKAHLLKDVEKLVKWYGPEIKRRYQKIQTMSETPARVLYYLLDGIGYDLPNGYSKRKTYMRDVSRHKRKVMEKLGYCGILDTKGRWNDDTPKQVIVFRKDDVVPLLKFRNPLYREEEQED